MVVLLKFVANVLKTVLIVLQPHLVMNVNLALFGLIVWRDVLNVCWAVPSVILVTSQLAITVVLATT